jgi:hypothetical protein
MRRITKVGLCLVVGLSMGADAASSASAANPEFTTIGRIKEVVSTPVKFEGTFGASSLTGHVAANVVSCTGGKLNGEAVAAKAAVSDVGVFVGCTLPNTMSCQSGGTPGEIVTNALEGELGALTATLPGLRLRPAVGTELVAFECGGGSVLDKVKGSVIASISGASGETVLANVIPTTLKLTYAQAGGIQKYARFIGGAPEQLMSEIAPGPTAELTGESAVILLKSIPFPGKLGVTR